MNIYPQAQSDHSLHGLGWSVGLVSWVGLSGWSVGLVFRVGLSGWSVGLFGECRLIWRFALLLKCRSMINLFKFPPSSRRAFDCIQPKLHSRSSSRHWYCSCLCRRKLVSVRWGQNIFKLLHAFPYLYKRFLSTVHRAVCSKRYLSALRSKWSKDVCITLYVG